MKNFMRIIDSNDNVARETYSLKGRIKANCFVNLKSVIYDLHQLQDKKLDYNFYSGKEYFYFNFCKFTITKCKKDSSYVMSSITKSVNNTLSECYELSGNNNENIPQWEITGKLFLIL
jgi:hypothetical protein